MNWTHIFIHHSGTKDNPDRLDFDNFRRYHTLARGWRDVGYNAGAELVERGVECLFGRPPTMTGSHCPGWNSKALGLVFAGDFMEEPPDLELLQIATHRIIRPWMAAYRIGIANVQAHRDHRDTDCPGDAFDMDVLRGLLRG